MKAILHIGVEKTGTTTIQRALAEERDRLAAGGVLFPQIFGSDNHMEIAVAAMDDDRRDELRLAELGRQDCSLTEYRRRVKTTLKDRASKGDYHSLLISNEHCHSRLTSVADVQRLKDFFSETFDIEEFKIIAYLRRQDRLAVSLHSTRVRLGGKGPLFPAAGGTLPVYFAFGQMLDRYAAVFGRDALVVRVFEEPKLKDGNLVANFFEVAGLGAPRVNPVPQNLSVSAAQLRFLERFNDAFPAIEGGQLNRARGPIAWVIRNACPGAPYRPPRSKALTFYKRFEEDNEHVRATYLQETDQFFDANFDDYPETETAQELTEDQCFEFISAIWQYAQKPK